MSGAESYSEMLKGLSFDQLKDLRDKIIKDLRSYENHSELDHLDIDLDLPSADTVYLKDMLRLSQVMRCMAEKFAVASHADID